MGAGTIRPINGHKRLSNGLGTGPPAAATPAQHRRTDDAGELEWDAGPGNGARPNGVHPDTEDLEEHYRRLVERLPVAVYRWEVGLDGRLLYLSPQAGPILGLDEHELATPELADEAWMDRVHEDDREAVLKAEERSDRTGEPLVSEYRFHREDDLVWIRDESVVVRREGAPDVFEGVISDITEAKRAEADLAESRSFISAIATNMAEGLVALDAEGRVEYMNASAERILGWTGDELRGLPFHATVHFQRADGTPYPADECPGHRVFETGETAHVDDDSYTRKDGQIVPVAYSSSPSLATAGCRAS